jgi:predicted phage terminase large subunit-like protein
LTPEEIVKARQRAKTDRLYLACDILGYDFTEDTHAELFDTYPAFHPVDTTPWVDQFKHGKDILVLWSRGHYKTTAVVVLVIQAILNHPDIRVLLMQGSLKVTKTLLKQIASHFEGTASDSKLKDIFPEFCGVKEEGQWKFGKSVIKLSATEFTTPARVKKQLAQATVTVASPNSIKTGQHYDLGVFDDLVNDKNYRSTEQLTKVEEDFNMALPLIDPGCPRFVSGTRYAFGDLYENIIRRNQGEWVVSQRTCWREDGSTPRFPQQKSRDGSRTIGFTREGLLQIMRDTPDIFASQYLNHPVSVSNQYLTKEQLLAATVSEKDSPALSQVVLFVDLAAEGQRPDDSVIVAGRIDSVGKMYVTDMRGSTFTVAQLALNVIDMALKHRPLKVMIERTSSAQYFVAYLLTVCKDKGVVLPIDYIKVDNRENAKNIRVQAMAGQVNQKRLFFFSGMSCWDKFVEQAVTFPKGKYGHDDYPDTVALMCQFFSKNYVGIPATPVTRHPVVAMFDRDPVAHLDAMGQESSSNGWGDCGDFICG